jgi:hypothetical protein
VCVGRCSSENDRVGVMVEMVLMDRCRSCLLPVMTDRIDGIRCDMVYENNYR